MISSSGILYYGPSPVNGAMVVAIISNMATKSINDKTGDMAQVDILLADAHPYAAIKSGEDTAVCGHCPLRWNVCYVNVGFGPSSKYKAYQRGSYPELTPTEAGRICKAKGKGIRMGSYGDPAMVPYEIWAELLAAAGTMHTSYTHQWAEPWFDSRMLEISMASVDHVNTVDKLQAVLPQARYYRMAQSYDDLAPNEVACPSKGKDGERRVQCKDCGLCAGTSRAAKSVVIVEGS